MAEDVIFPKVGDLVKFGPHLPDFQGTIYRVVEFGRTCNGINSCYGGKAPGTVILEKVSGTAKCECKTTCCLWDGGAQFDIVPAVSEDSSDFNPWRMGE